MPLLFSTATPKPQPKPEPSAVPKPAPTLGIYPLDQFQLDDDAAVRAAYALWGHYPPVIHHYLRVHVFPRVMRCQELKISASGQALGSSLLFESRLAFSGTPSDLLPVEEEERRQLSPCVFERGSEGAILDTLIDPARVSARRTGHDWSVRGILFDIATAGTGASAEPPRISQRIDVLIDTGALVTGMSNEEVAQYLLDHGLAWAKGVVFLDEHDEKQVLLRCGGHDDAEAGAARAAGGRRQVVKLAQCGLPWHERFAYYDQVHTTGMDIKHHDRARALITVSKDTTFRDFAQGAYRMRGLAKGKPQSLEVLLVPEVQGLINTELGPAAPPDGGARPMAVLPAAAVGAVAAWLLINQARLESQQMLQLCVQNVDSVTQRRALAALLAEPRAGAGRAGGLLPLTEAFTEPVAAGLPAAVPVPKSFLDSLRERAARNAAVCAPDAAGAAAIDAVLGLAADQTAGSAAASAEAWKHLDLDAAQVQTREKDQDREQEMEQTRQKQQEMEREASPWKATSRDLDKPIPWRLADVLEGARRPGAFHPVAHFQLQAAPGGDSGGAPADAGPLLAAVITTAPGVFLSENFAASSFTSPRARRLRALHAVLQYGGGGGGGGGGGEGGGGPAGRPHFVALSLLEAATVRRAVGELADTAGGPDARVSQVRLCLPGGEVLAGAAPSARSRAPGTARERDATSAGAQPAEVQLLRFFDCQVDFNEAQGAGLLSVLEAVPAGHRQRFFRTTVLARRRDMLQWTGKAVAPYLQLESLRDLMDVRGLKERINAALRGLGMSGTELAREIDANRDQALSPEEIVRYLATMTGMPSEEQLARLKGPLMLVADESMDGRISYEEFIQFLT